MTTARPTPPAIDADHLPEGDAKVAAVRSMFDAIAPRYDFLNHVLSAGIDRRWRARAIRSLRLTGSEVVLDVCTGTADLAIAARTATPRAARVVGVDFAGAMLEIGRDKAARAGLAHEVMFVRGDATRIPVADSSMDAVTVAFGIRNVEDVPAACREMRRVLRRGGRLAILEFAIPTMPVIRTAYLTYFRHILPAVGRLVSRHSAAYGYLPDSVGAFATPTQLMSTLEASGFVDVAAVRMTCGIVFLYTARRGD